MPALSKDAWDHIPEDQGTKVPDVHPKPGSVLDPDKPLQFGHELQHGRFHHEMITLVQREIGLGDFSDLDRDFSVPEIQAL